MNFSNDDDDDDVVAFNHRVHLLQQLTMTAVKTLCTAMIAFCSVNNLIEGRELGESTENKSTYKC